MRISEWSSDVCSSDLNQGRNLTELDFSALQELRAALADSRRLLEEAKGLSFDVEQARRGYARLYPDGYGAGTSIGDMASDAHAHRHQAPPGLRPAVTLQAQTVGQAAADETRLSAIVDRIGQASLSRNGGQSGSNHGVA